jgi:hypothetical protein
MANDRIIIRCDGCQAWTTWAKHYPGSLCVKLESVEWVNAHMERCHPGLYENNLGGKVGFTLFTEGPALPRERQNALPP